MYIDTFKMVQEYRGVCWKICLPGRIFLSLPIFIMCVTTTQKFSFSDPTCAILIFAGAECVRTFFLHSIPMDVIVCLTITYIASESLCHCNFVQTTF